MAKLYFRYGTVNSAKTLNLLAVAHNYESQGKNVVVAIPKADTRYGEGVIRARIGLERKADIIIESSGSVMGIANVEKVPYCILVDEAQFLSRHSVESLRYLTTTAMNVPVICYGLRADFKGQLFEGSAALLALADSVEEIKTICSLCGRRKAIMNMKFVGGKPMYKGPSIELGGEEMYKPACWSCWDEGK
jgi:thymidine kinase